MAANIDRVKWLCACVMCWPHRVGVSVSPCFFHDTLSPNVNWLKVSMSSMSDLGPVARSLVNANRWLGDIQTYRFLWYVTLVLALTMPRATRPWGPQL